MTSGATVYLVDDEADIRAAVGQWLTLGGFEPRCFEGAEEALAGIGAEFEGVVISDVRMPGMDGLAFLAALQRIDRELPVILITAHGDVPMAVQAMRAGAWDFIEKPFEPEQLTALVQKALTARAHTLERRRARTRSEAPDADVLEQALIGQSPAIAALRQQIVDYAASAASVLIEGETGSGKELIAQSLHRLSPRKDGPFVAVNCAAIPETMLEAELFGHEAGAFTGATKARQGHFEAASGGTLFLDELTALPAHLQPALLRVLQEREVARLGARKPIPLDLRIVAATNEDVDQAVQEGRLRRDLLYRLNTLTLRAPPLRERAEDAVSLFETFAERCAEREGLPVPQLGPADREAIMAYPWPGNVRELINLAERAVLRARTAPVSFMALLHPHALEAREHVLPETLRERVDAFERQLIDASLRRHRGTISDVMDELGLPRRTLNEKMQRYSLNRRDYV